MTKTIEQTVNRNPRAVVKTIALGMVTVAMALASTAALAGGGYNGGGLNGGGLNGKRVEAGALSIEGVTVVDGRLVRR